MAQWLIFSTVDRLWSMADRSDSERMRDFDIRLTNRQTDIQTDIWDSRVASATENPSTIFINTYYLAFLNLTKKS